ncbi:MAG: hypothetical protein E7289_01270 [Lachnospiraceae bacterium]|nr:hypothetical protein [Lachnospiraceae bacterium]
MEQNIEQPDFQEYLDSTDVSQYTERPQKPNIFMMLSLMMGILAFTSCTFIFTAMIAAGLSILFAILSKGNHSKMNFMAKSGITAAIVGLVLSVIITSSAVYLVFNSPEYRELLNTTYESMYGQTFDEALEEMYPSTQGGGTYDAGN